MSLCNVRNDKVLISVEDDILDESGNKFWIEIKFARTMLKRLLSYSSNNLPESFNNDLLFTKREFQVLSCLAQGKNNYQISKELNVSIHTTKAHIQNIFKKLCVKDRTVAVVKAIKDNIIDI